MIFKQNAKAFSLYAVVDVRRRHEMIYFNISETTRASNFKFYPNVALDSLYISTGNDIIIYFQSASNHISVFILGHVRVAIS